MSGPRTTRLDDFAELMSRGLSVEHAGSRVGATPTYARTMLQRICKRLGPQAR